MKPALVLVDLQTDFLARPGLEPPAPVLVSHAAALLEGCRRAGVPVLHVWTSIRPDGSNRLPHWKAQERWWCVVGTPGHAPPEPLRPLPGERVIHKSGFNPFRSGEFDALLVGLGADTLLLAGVHLHACVRTAAIEAVERGLNVLVAEDAVGSDDPAHAAASRRWLAGRGVRFGRSESLLGELTGGTDAPRQHFSPRNLSEPLFEVSEADTQQMDDAITRAAGAQERWRALPVSGRTGALAGLPARLEALADEFARQMAVEIGKPLSHGLEEVRRAAKNARDALERATHFCVQTCEREGVVRRPPHGVVALISPWNNPVAIPLGKIIPALTYGNAVVWKPAPAATRIAERLLALLNEVGLPPHRVELLTGDAEAAQRIASHTGVDAVTFTGSGRAGAALEEICARRRVPFQAELGGNNAAIVWEGADLRHAAGCIASGAFGFAGQRCTANRRVIVARRFLDAFLTALRAAAEKLLWDDPLNPLTEIGPVLTARKAAEHETWLAAAQADPTVAVERLQVERARADWRRAGAYAQPALVTCARADAPFVQEETMSPLLIVQPADDFEEALALCNGVRHGLAAALFGGDTATRRRFLEGARVGMLKFDQATAGASPCLPFGGWKASGIGPPEHGDADALFFTRWQTVYGQTGAGETS